MVNGFDTNYKKLGQNFSSINTMDINKDQSFGAAAPVKMLQNTSSQNLRPLSQDSLYYEEHAYPQNENGGMFDSLKYILPVWFVLGKGVDFYNYKCSGDYLNSLPAKLGRLGDKIACSKAANSSVVKGLGSFLNRTMNTTVEHWRNNSTVLRNIIDNSTHPECLLAKSAMYTQQEELASEVNHLFERYLNGGGKTPALKNLVPSSEEKEFIEKIFRNKKVSKIDKINCLQLRRINPQKYSNANIINAVLAQRVNNPQIMKETLLKELGYDLATYKKYISNPTKYAKELQEFALKAGSSMKVYNGNYNLFGAIFRRKSDMSQIANKMLSISKDAVDAAGRSLPPKTALGRGISKTMQGLMRGLTFGGGKLGLLIFVAPTLVETYKNAKEAPDNQKVGTIATGLVDSVSWVATFPASMRLMHKIGGLRYLGMTKNQVAQYRKALELFHADNAAGKFKSEKSYSKAWEKVKALKSTGNLNMGQKILKGLGFGITQDLEMKQAWKNPNLKGVKKLGNVFRGRRVGNFFRHCVGGPGKLALFFGTMMYVVSPLIEKPLEWIFGKPYDRNEAAEKRAEEEAKKASIVDTTKQGVSDSIINAVDNFNRQMDAANTRPTVSVIPPKEPPVAFAKSQNAEFKADAYKYIPSQSCDIPRDSGEFNERTYIPNQDSNIVKIQENLDFLDIINNRAEKAEQNAYNILNRRP